MRLLKSVEELLYELVTWLLFYPLTFWRCLRHPVRMMRYAGTELGDAEGQQYDDALSPPIFLLITLFIAHLVELRFGAETKVALPQVFADERNLLFFRAIAFSLFPLFMALRGVRQRGARLTRRILKPAFYSQCYTAAPFILSVDLAVIIGQHANMPAIVAGIAIFTIGLVWYLNAQTIWFASEAGIGRVRAFLTVAATVALGFLAVLVMTFMAALATTDI
jgi:hypothetical protein